MLIIIINILCIYIILYIIISLISSLIIIIIFPFPWSNCIKKKYD